MTSTIRELLTQAQAAEAEKDYGLAVRLLKEAERYYRERQLEGRAEQMARNVARLEEARGASGDGFGDELLEDSATMPGGAALSPYDRGPQLAAPALEAWCSFCCKPKQEVGDLVAGPAGAFICKSCVAVSAVLHGGSAEVAAPRAALKHRPALEPKRLHELPAQRHARERWERRRPKVGLLLGPAGSGKSALLEAMGRPVRTPIERLPEADVIAVDLSQPLGPDDELRLLRWLEEHPQRQLMFASPGDAPQPFMVLRGEHGDEPVYDTKALSHAVGGRLSDAVLARVEQLLPLTLPDREALESLARGLLVNRGVELSDAALAQLVDQAERSGRGTHELVALIARIPPGRYA